MFGLEDKRVASVLFSKQSIEFKLIFKIKTIDSRHALGGVFAPGLAHSERPRTQSKKYITSTNECLSNI